MPLRPSQPLAGPVCPSAPGYPGPGQFDMAADERGPFEHRHAPSGDGVAVSGAGVHGQHVGDVGPLAAGPRPCGSMPMAASHPGLATGLLAATKGFPLVLSSSRPGGLASTIITRPAGCRRRRPAGFRGLAQRVQCGEAPPSAALSAGRSFAAAAAARATSFASTATGGGQPAGRQAVEGRGPDRTTGRLPASADPRAGSGRRARREWARRRPSRSARSSIASAVVVPKLIHAHQAMPAGAARERAVARAASTPCRAGPPSSYKRESRDTGAGR